MRYNNNCEQMLSNVQSSRTESPDDPKSTKQTCSSSNSDLSRRQALGTQSSSPTGNQSRIDGEATGGDVR